MDDFSLPGRTCVVTGGTQGIGWAIVQALADRGAHVYACGRSYANLDRAEQARARLPASNRIHLARCDVTDRESYEHWLQSIFDERGRLDVLVNNAAYVRWRDVTSMSVAEQQLTMRVAYDGMVFGVKKVLPWMLAQKEGHIVNIGSITGSIFVGGAGAAYSAAKASVEAYTQILAVELRETPVRTTLMRLGTVAGTDFFRAHVSYKRMPRLLDFLPYTTPPAVARAVVRAIEKRQRVVTLPRYLALLRVVFVIAPGLSQWLVARGGSGKRDYASGSARDPVSAAEQGDDEACKGGNRPD